MVENFDRMRYILNSAVITSPGRYDYRHLDIEQARAWISAGVYRSTIRYQETSAALAALIGKPVEVRNEAIQMQPGDEALVFRLVFPPGTKRLPMDRKGKLDVQFVLDHCEIGLLKRIE